MRAAIGKKANVLVILLLLGLMSSSPAYGQDGKYTLYELGTLGGPNTWAYDINESSQIVGVGETNLFREGRVSQGFIGTKDGISPLFPGEDARSSANAINRDGTVAGYKSGRAFMVGGGSPFVDLGVLPGAAQSSGMSINAGKKVVGYSWNEGVWEKGALWERDGSGNYLNNDVGTLGGFYTRATGMNDSDEVTGYSQNAGGSNRAFRWKKVTGNDPLTDLGVLAGFTDSVASRINNRGVVAGYSLKMDQYYTQTAQACRWEGSSIQELKKKNSAGILESVLYSEAYGINDSGSIVGMYWSEEHQSYRAFIWDAVNEMRDLNSLVPDNSGLVLVAAYAINNKGEIVGYGNKVGSTNATAFLLVPPVPPDPVEDPLVVGINIRPWNPNNKINLHNKWVLIPIAILSNDGFDAPAEVDRASLTFGKIGNENSLAYCVRGKADVNHDRRKDLICYFHEKAMGFQCGDTVGTLQGKTLTGDSFVAQDKIQVVPCPPPRKKHCGKK